MPHAPHDPAMITRARALYAEGAPIRAILRETGLSEGTLYYWLDGGSPSVPPEQRLAPIPRRNEQVLGQRRKALRASRPSLVARLWRTAERQVAEIETRLLAAGGAPEALERDAKTLAVLARTVRDLVALDAEQKRGSKPEGCDEASFPRDLDAFRHELAEKLAQLGALEAGA